MKNQNFKRDLNFKYNNPLNKYYIHNIIINPHPSGNNKFKFNYNLITFILKNYKILRKKLILT